jgi:hypothetical protein
MNKHGRDAVIAICITVIIITIFILNYKADPGAWK